MKRTLSLILAALILASSMTACGNTTPSAETNVSETNTTETNAPETSAAETEATAPVYATDKITENGMAKAHIVLFDGADKVEQYAVEELVHHIKLVSGAEVSVTNAMQADSLPIIIATPDSYPELENLFPDDLSWLREIGEENSTERYGDDGFAIRLLDNKLYIFGATPRGALNGVYDFIEDNMGVLWTRAEDALPEGTVYKEMPTIELVKTDYREKSPFTLRTWTVAWSSELTWVMNSRNKLNSYATNPQSFSSSYSYDDIGLSPFITNHNIKWWIQNSPIYDPNEQEYWNTDLEGNYLTPDQSMQVNFWSEKTADALAASVIAFLDKYKESENIKFVGICCEDNGYELTQVPLDTQPFEYAPGQFVDPSAHNYISTVFYTMLNKVARQVGEVYPDVRLHTYTYVLTEVCPECDIEDNVYLTYAPITEDLTASLFDPENENNAAIYSNYENWMKKSTNFSVYNYYGCYIGAAVYERPVWDIMQEHMIYYAENGFNGVCCEGVGDSLYVDNWHYAPDGTPNVTSASSAWGMNALTFWLYAKLSWNPYADLDALIVEFCDKCYGDASPYMQEYYRLLKAGWDEGIPSFRENDPFSYSTWYTDPNSYLIYFLSNPDFTENEGLDQKILEVLNNAWDAANDTEKERIRYIKEAMEIALG